MSEVVVQDISEGGLLLRSKYQHRAGERIRILIDLNGESFCANGQVIRSTKGLDHNLTHACADKVQSVELKLSERIAKLKSRRRSRAA